MAKHHLPLMLSCLDRQQGVAGVLLDYGRTFYLQELFFLEIGKESRHCLSGGADHLRDLSTCPGDRLLVYTDGVIAPENAKGESFGHSKLAEVILRARSSPASDVTNKLLIEIRAWQPARMAQQDDIALVIIDVH